MEVNRRGGRGDPGAGPLLRVALCLLLVLGVVLGFREIVSPDLGFHLSTARWILEHRSLPRTDPFTYTVAAHACVDLQWLFQLLFYGLLRAGGSGLVVACTTALTLAFAWLATLCAVLLGLIALVWSGRWYDLTWSPHRRGAGFNASCLPVEACDFLVRTGIQGRILNTWDQGGYISWATHQPVFLYSHGEVMGQDSYQEYLEAKEPHGFALALQKWRPTVAIVPFQGAPYWLYFLHQDRSWRMVHASEHTAVFLHSSVAPQVPALARPQAGLDYPVFDEETIDRLVRTAAAAGPPSLGEWLQGSRAYPSREVARSAFYLHTGEVGACIGVGLSGIQHTPFRVSDLLLTLGHAFEARHLYERADLCFDAFLRADRDPVFAREILVARAARPRK